MPNTESLKPIEPHEFRGEPGVFPGALRPCVVCGLNQRLCQLTYRPRK